MDESSDALAALVAEIRACRLCAGDFEHEPRPVLRVGSRAPILIAGQAPGTRVHASGMPFTDPSGDRLRAWMGIDEATFYDTDKIAIAPMGFCFPGLDARGGDRPPRPICARTWRDRLMTELPEVTLVLVIGIHAKAWHLPEAKARGLTETVRDYETFLPGRFPLPHPSWRNNAWLKRNPWFERDAIPRLRAEVARILGKAA